MKQTSRLRFEVSEHFYVKVKNYIEQSYGASPVIWDHTVFAAIRHSCTLPFVTPAAQADLPSLEGWKAELMLMSVIIGYLDDLPVHRPIQVLTT